MSTGSSIKNSQSLMKAIKAVHSLVEKEDLGKVRHSQENIGALFTVNKNKEVEYETMEIEGVEAEWVRPNRRHMKKQMILYCHGGGYITGSIKYARSITTKLASGTSMDVLSFNYGLAPEDPYPRSVEDAMKVWDYLMHKGYGSRDIVLAGDSAGGNLALVLALSLRAADRMLPQGLVLLSPWTDFTFSGKSFIERAEVDPVITEEYIQFAADAYIGERDRSDPLISPLFADLSGLPPVYIQVGEHEMLYHDSVRLHKNILKASGFSKLDIYKGMWHVFQMSPFKDAYEAIDQIAEFIFSLYR